MPGSIPGGTADVFIIMLKKFFKYLKFIDESKINAMIYCGKGWF